MHEEQIKRPGLTEDRQLRLIFETANELPLLERNTKMMTPSHKRWDEFVQRMEGPEGCNFRMEKDQLLWKCPGGAAKAILKSMGFGRKAVLESLTYSEEYGGFCDCEIVFNVAWRFENPQMRSAVPPSVFCGHLRS